MAVQSLNQFPCVKGVVASNQPLAEPKGSVTRGSNLLMTARGALDVCDGSQILHDPGGSVGSGLGKVMANFLFQPTGVSSYYLSLQKALTLPLGPPNNLSLATAGGGTLAAATYFYVVTALDGAGGETTISNEASIATGASGKNTLTWNVVPNATQYNVYRSTSAGTETLLSGTNLPVSQAAFGALSVTFVDDGTATLGPSLALQSISKGNNIGLDVSCILVAPGFPNLTAGLQVTIAGVSPSSFNGTFAIDFTTGPQQISVVNHAIPANTIGTGGTLSLNGSTRPPLVDTTQQTVLYKMPVIAGSPASLPVAYNTGNIVALFPADVLAIIDGGGGGGSGGGGGTGGGGATGGGSTPSGGIPGNVSFIPMFRQFTNRAVIALGNGFPPQIFSDPLTLVNPATTAVISAISVDAFGVVTVTTATPHGINAAQVGGNVVIANVTDQFYNYTGPTIAIISTTQYKVRNLAAIGQGASSGGTSTTTSLPIYNTFVPSYPVWAATENLIAGDVIVPLTQPTAAIYLVVIQGGQTGSVEPTWPTGGSASVGQNVRDGTVIYQVAGLLNSAAPAPPGAAHIEVYSGALWVLNTAPSNTASGLDGPCAIRMSSINQPNSWNPINQAFLDKDDGQEGMGLAKFTITAQGIPPEGSLIAFKNYSPYQIVGVFGASNFAIQAVSSDMGCTAPRTLQFVPGFGIMRYTHLGIAIFNGVKDEIISEQIRPYLFPNNDITYSDITVVDSTWVSVSWSAQTATPPMYVVAMPIGTSGGQLTRLFCYDLVFKSWLPVDLPFPISTLSQFRTVSANPVTVFGGFSDGCLSRWQAGDVLWDTGAVGARSPSKVNWSGRSMTVASNDTDQRVYLRRLVVTGFNSSSGGSISVSWRMNGVQQGTRTFSVGTNTFFDLDVAIGLTGKEFDATISGNTDAQLDGLTYELEPRPLGVVAAI